MNGDVIGDRYGRYYGISVAMSRAGIQVDVMCLSYYSSDVIRGLELKVVT